MGLGGLIPRKITFFSSLNNFKSEHNFELLVEVEYRLPAIVQPFASQTKLKKKSISYFFLQIINPFFMETVEKLLLLQTKCKEGK